MVAYLYSIGPSHLSKQSKTKQETVESNEEDGKDKHKDTTEKESQGENLFKISDKSKREKSVR